MLTYGFAKKILIKKNWRQKRDFCCFFYDVKNGHFCSCPNSNADILQKSRIFCVYWVSKFEVLSSELWKLIVKAMFARLRKLQFFKAVESCTSGYGRFRCQRVNGKTLSCMFSALFHFVLSRNNKQNIAIKTLCYFFV